MRTAIIHLTDLHLCELNNNLIDRIRDVPVALSTNFAHLDQVLVVCTGDVTDKGLNIGFSVAQLIFEELLDAVRTHYPNCSTHGPYMVPGNHDIVEPTHERFIFDAAIHAVRQGTDLTIRQDELYHLLSYQRDFWQLAATYDSSVTSVAGQFCRQVTLDNSEHPVSLILINTAFSCDTKETKGQIRCPVSQLPTLKKHYINIACLHHPLSWISETDTTYLRKWIHDGIDFVLSGHEHDGLYTSARVHNKPSTRYLEGDAFRFVNNNDRSGFSVIVIDTETARMRAALFSWDGTRYYPLHGYDEVDIAKGKHSSDGWILSYTFERSLHDTGMLPRSHSILRHIDDYFVYPKIQEIKISADSYRPNSHAPKSKTSKHSYMSATPSPTQRPAVIHGQNTQRYADRIESAEILLESLPARIRVAITSEPKGGASKLVHKLFFEMRDRGYVPIIVSAKSVLSSAEDDVLAIIKQELERHYDDATIESYERLPKGQRVLFLEDLHGFLARDHEQSKIASIGELFDIIGEKFEHIFVTCNEFWQVLQLWSGKTHEVLYDFKSFRLLRPTREHRRELIRKNASTIAGKPLDSFAMRKLELDIEALLNEGTYAPFSHELFGVISHVLGDHHGGNQFGAFGYYYDQLVRSSLVEAIGSMKSEIGQATADVVTSFLSELAMRMYASGGTSISKDDFFSLVAEFRRLDNPLDQEQTLAALRKARVLDTPGDRICFAEKYQFYYYLAMRFKDQLIDDNTRDSARSELSKCVDHMHYDHESDIVLFAIYFAGDTWLINRLGSRSPSILPDCKESNLSSDFDFATNPYDVLGQLPDASGASDTDPDNLDSESHLGVGDSGSQVWETYVGMSLAFNTLRVLGAAIRNYPGKISGEPRSEIMHGAAKMSLRAMTLFTDLVKNGNEELDAFAKRFLHVNTEGTRSHNPVLNRGLVTSQLLALCGFGVIRRIVYSFGSPHLALTVRRVFMANDDLASRYIGIAFQLDYADTNMTALVRLIGDEFEEAEKHPTSRMILRNVVAVHLRTFSRPANERMALSSAVDLAVDDSRLVGSPTKPIGIGKRRKRKP
ncbi:MAG: metallophosphoesterase [Fimbriimonadaceae bacterium]|nr:metallophosphoesterase [Fimbriimonadaceae bacterium]